MFGSALQAAAYRGHQQIVALLIDEGANVNTQSGRYGNTLLAAVLNGNQQIVGVLLDNGVDVNAQGLQLIQIDKRYYRDTNQFVLE